MEFNEHMYQTLYTRYKRVKQYIYISSFLTLLKNKEINNFVLLRNIVNKKK